MDNKEALESQARELWAQAMIYKEIAELEKDTAKGLIGEPKESADFKKSAAENLKKYLALRQEANDLYRKLECPSRDEKIKAVK